MKIDFVHTQSAHCENGVTVNLLRHHGWNINEPLVFGVGSGIFYSHFPFIKLNGIPVTSYRIWPGAIFSRFASNTGVKMHSEKFSSEQKAMAALDKELERGNPVGMLTSVFYLTYLPAAYRFHFNAHNIVVYGKEGDEYMVSDPVMDTVTTIASADLQRARFAKGVPEPKGKMYYPKVVPETIDWRQPMLKGIKRAGFDMTKIPIPILATKGMRWVAKRMRHWPEKLGNKHAILHLGHVVRMQEEIGTGGGGFRFIYAAFLQQAAEVLQHDEIGKLSEEMTATGDLWRSFAHNAARICKNRKAEVSTFGELADMVLECSHREDKIFGRLYDIARNYK